jgi:uncharacterized protein (TIGR04255 family)
MSLPDERFPNSPLIEAVFMVRFHGNLAVDAAKDQIQKAFAPEFPALLIPDLAKIKNHPLLAPLRLANASDTELVEFSISSFSYHQKAYTHWKEFKARAHSMLSRFLDIAKIGAVQQTGLRYVNHIPVLREDGLVPLNRFLKFGFRLPSSIPEKLEQFSVQLTTKLDPGELRTVVKLKQAGDPAGTEIIVLDFDYLTVQESLPVSSLADRMQVSHDHTKQVFLSLLTDDYLKLLRETR